ncbi:hypothetical protein Tco_0691238 [Tanacetum coccineum]
MHYGAKTKKSEETVLTDYTPYPSRKIRRICACTSQETTKTYTPYPGAIIRHYTNQRVTSITVNGKATYELKGRFLDDLRENAFSGTNREDVVEHIEYFLKIVDPIDLPNVNHERLRLAVFPISLVGNASKRFDEFKGSLTTWVDLTEKFFRKYYPPSRTCNVVGTKAKKNPTNTMFEKWLASKFANHNGKTKWPTCNSNEDGFCNGGELPGMVRIGYMTYFQDYEWNGRACNNNDIQEREGQHKEGRCDLFDDPAQESLVCKIRRFEMIKYSFGQEEEYVAIKKYEYDDLIRTNKDACHAYQEIFHNMDKGWLVTRAE